MEYIKIFKKEILFFINTQWRRPISIIICLCLASFVFLYWLSIIDINKLTYSKLLIIIILLLVIALLWIFYRRIPKTPKGKIGFTLAIFSDSAKQRDIIANDFILNISRLLSNNKNNYQFSFITLPNYYANKIINRDDANRYLYATRSHFMIYGRAKIRKIEGIERHVLNLEGIVRHKPIPEEISDKFSSEFNELFPRRLIIARENDLFSFEFTAEWVNIVAMYIIGIAALLSGDLSYSERLFEELNTKLINTKAKLPAIIKIKQRLPSRLSEIYLQRARLSYNNWRQFHSPEFLAEVKYWIDKLKLFSPNHYNAHLMGAVMHFIENRDIFNAKKDIRKCKDIKDATWMYSSAFLYAYTGDMKKANRMYKRAFGNPCEHHVIFEVEEFICWVLDEEPDKTQLYFCLGLLNYFAKEDKASALRDFEKFLEANPGVMFDEEKRLAETYIETINKDMK